MGEEYVCPRCDPNTKLNFSNLKQLGSQGQELIKKTFKLIQNNRNSNPFKEPVDPKVNPNYYNIVKEPMGGKQRGQVRPEPGTVSGQADRDSKGEDGDPGSVKHQVKNNIFSALRLYRA